MNIAQAVKSVLSNYVTFGGRAARFEFWWWWLVNSMVGIVIAGTAVASRDNSLLMGYYLITFLQTLAVTVRRHPRAWLGDLFVNG